MSETPELTEEEYRELITDIAKDAIREYCVDADGTIQPDNANLAASQLPRARWRGACQ